VSFSDLALIFAIRHDDEFGIIKIFPKVPPDIGVNPGGWGVTIPSRSWFGGLWGVAGVVDGLRNIITSYHVQEVCSKVVIFQAK